MLLAGALAGGIWLYARYPKAVNYLRTFRSQTVANMKRSSDSVVSVSGKAKDVLQRVGKNMEDSYVTLRKTNEATLAIVQKTDRALYGADQGSEDPAMQAYYGQHGIMGQVHGLLGGAQLAVASLRDEVAAVSQQSQAALKGLDPVLVNAALALDDLDKAIQVNDPKLQQIADHVDETVRTVNARLADPNIAATLDNVHEISTSINHALLPWRERAKLLKTIVATLLGIVKVNIPPR